MKTLRTQFLRKFFAAASLTLGIIAFPLASSAGDNIKNPPQPKGDFAKGAALWANTCVRCHNMRDPKELTDRKWKPVVFHMRIRAGITGKDARDILAFLQQSNGK